MSHFLTEGGYSYAHEATSGKLTRAVEPDSGSLSFTYNGALITQVTLSGAVSGRGMGIYLNHTCKQIRSYQCNQSGQKGRVLD